MKEFPEGYHFTRKHDFEVKIKRREEQTYYGAFAKEEDKKYSYIYVWSLDEKEDIPEFIFTTDGMIDRGQGLDIISPKSHVTIDIKDHIVYIRHDNHSSRNIKMDGKRAEIFIEAYETWRTHQIILGGEL